MIVEATETGLSPTPPAEPIADWDARPWVFGTLLALCALGIHFALDLPEPPVDGSFPAWRAGLAAFFGFGGLAAAFTLDRGKIVPAAIFAGVIGLIMGGIAWHVAAVSDRRAGVEFSFAAGVFFTLLALPLFQAGFVKTRLATDYHATHFHLWADAVSGAGALAFVGLAWLLLLVLDQLFGLIGIGAIGELMEADWFRWVWSGAAFGAALGVLRENLKIIGTLQNVVLVVLSLLAVPFAGALLVFLVLLVLSGGAALWETTDSATPVLLACAAGAFILANAIIRDDDAARSRNIVMQAAALVLAGVILPLVVFAAIGMGLRIDQRGLSPERIWALIAIAVASAYGVAMWATVARGRISGWMAQARRANLNLAVIVSGLALVAALPFWDFGAVAARQQVARLASGKVALKDFDFAALRWDFGDAGRDVLARLAAGEGEQARLAGLAQIQVERPYGLAAEEMGVEFAGELRIQPANPALEARLRKFLTANRWLCEDYCVALDVGTTAYGQRDVVLVERGRYERIVLGTDATGVHDATAAEIMVLPPPVEGGELNASSKVEIREEAARYIYVDGKKVGPPLE